MTQLTNTPYPVVCFGEILWDILPTGTVPGGAPMNVAYHLKKLGIEPAMITRIGRDALGQSLIALMEKSNISTDYFQMDELLPTGTVNAFINPDHEVSYDIVMPVAWDQIGWEASLENLVSRAVFFVFGSLAGRNEISRTTLFRLMEAASFKVLDINLRAPHYNKKIIDQLLQQKIGLLKLNASELELITGWFSTVSTETDRLQYLQDKYQIANIVVTKGGDGASFNSEGRVFHHPGYPVKVGDTVGSGDSFLAALLSKLAANVAPNEALRFACAVGALIASYHGACPEYNLSEINPFLEKDLVTI